MPTKQQTIILHSNIYIPIYAIIKITFIVEQKKFMRVL